MSARTELRDSNLNLVDTQLDKMKKAKRFLALIKSSKNYYKTSGFIVDDSGCFDAFYEAIDTFDSSIDRYIKYLETGKTAMVNNSSWAGESD